MFPRPCVRDPSLPNNVSSRYPNASRFPSQHSLSSGGLEMMRFGSSVVGSLVIFFPALVSAQLTEIPQGTATQPQGGAGQTMTVLMRRVSAEGGSAPPEKPKKAREKCREEVKKGKWAAACDHFKKAIAAYPRYALAWVELGRAQAQQNNFADAQQSFHQAVMQDSGFLEGYAELARIAVI